MSGYTTMPRLLPDDAYPAALDEAERDRVDAHMRAELHTIPTEPGEYVDRDDAHWTLDTEGGWTDPTGERRGPEHTPALVWAGLHRGVASDGGVHG